MRELTNRERRILLAVAEGRAVSAVLSNRRTLESYWPAFLEAGRQLCPKWRASFDADVVEPRKQQEQVSDLDSREEAFQLVLDTKRCVIAWLDDWAILPEDDSVAGAVMEAFALAGSGSTATISALPPEFSLEWREEQGDGSDAFDYAFRSLRGWYGTAYGMPEALESRQQVYKAVAEGPQYNPLFETRDGFMGRWSRHAAYLERFVSRTEPTEPAPRAARRESEWGGVGETEIDPRFDSTVERDSRIAARSLLLGETIREIAAAEDVLVSKVERRLPRFKRGLGLAVTQGRPKRNPH